MPSTEDPGYRGLYHSIYENPERVRNADAAYVYQNRSHAAKA